MQALTGNSDHHVSHTVQPLAHYPGGVVVVEINDAFRYAYGVLVDGSVQVREQSDSLARMRREAEHFSRALAVDRDWTGRE